MKMVFRLGTVFLLACLLTPQPGQAGGDRGQAPYDVGEALFARKNYPAALKQYRKALAKNDVRAHYRMGLIYEVTGRGRDALEQYRRFAALGQPDDQQGDVARRIAALEERLKRKTTGSGKLLEQGKRLYAQGKYREAEAVLLQAAAKNKSQPEIHFYLGEVYLKLEAYAKATSEYRKAKGAY